MTATTTPGAETSGSPNAPGPVPSASEAFAEGDRVLKVAVKDPSTLDPMRISDPGSTLVARQLYEGLTRWDPLEEKVLPAAAESWKVSGQGTIFTFRLRSDMTFHNGKPVTSRSFQYAFNRVARRSNASDLAYTLERIEGFEAVNRDGGAVTLSGISTPSPTTLVIRLTEPYQDFPAILTHPGLVPLDQEAVEDIDTFLTEPVGNGPFRVAQPWSPGQPIVMRRFPGFLEPAPLDGIIFLPYEDAAASWLLFVNGDIDVAEVPADEIDTAKERYGESGFKPLLAGYYFGFNLRSRKLQNPNLRRAISRAIDRETIAKTIYKNTLLPPRGIVQSGMPGFQQNFCTALCEHAPEVAKGLISNLDSRSRSIILEYTNEPPHDEVAHNIKRTLEAVGLRVRLKRFNFQNYLRHLRDGKQSVYRLGWISEYPVPDILSALFRSGSPDNHSRFSSTKVDRLLARAERSSSPGLRQQLFVDAEKEILRSAPIVPIGTFFSHWAAQPDVKNFIFDTMGGFDAAAITLADP